MSETTAYGLSTRSVDADERRDAQGAVHTDDPIADHARALNAD